MKRFEPNEEPSAWGSFEDAEALRRWSFERRTPEQRLAWLQAALELAYQSGALKPRRPDTEAPRPCTADGTGIELPRTRTQD
jgi:hypothetical protein